MEISCLNNSDTIQERDPVECKLREGKDFEVAIDELMHEIDKRNEMLCTTFQTLQCETIGDATREELLHLCSELMGLNRLRELLISDLCTYITDMK